MLNDLSAYQYDLPNELIAQYPVTPRDHSRLLVIDRHSGNMEEMKFYELADFLQNGDRLVFNNTRVIPARLFGKKETGGAVEFLLMEPLGEDRWDVLARPARKLKVGVRVIFSDSLACRVLEEKEGGVRVVQFEYEGDFEEILANTGEMPLPHYLNREEDKAFDPERYQTVYAKESGAVAAPTAGLHFTDELINRLVNKGVTRTEVTLHVGMGTFRPVMVEDIREHKMHHERFYISDQAAKELNQTAAREICVGTTCCRTLESAALENGMVQAGGGNTDIFIYPGYTFKKVQSLLTNFHLPGSSLLMLISAFAGYELTMEIYEKAIRDRFRFYSYGDSMLIL